MKTTPIFFIVTLAGGAILTAQAPSAAPATPAPKTAEVQEVKPSAPVPKAAEVPAPKTAETQELKSGAPAPSSLGVECRPVVEQLRQNVQKAPNHVLTLLEDAVIANGGHCVGDLVQAAIVASNADAATVKKIVFVAITNAPKQAPLIAEAAVAASPKNADSVRAAFAEAFDEKNPRLKPADPAAKPAWEQPGAPVGAPKMGPVPPVVARSEAPAPVSPNPNRSPQVAANSTERNPYTDIEGGGSASEKWELLHDGVVDSGKPGAKPGAVDESAAPGGIVPPPPLEEEKKKFGFDSLSFLVPKLPELPEVDHPVDLYFASPFGGIPAP